MQKSRNRIYLLTLLLIGSITNINALEYDPNKVLIPCKEHKPFLNDYKRGWFVKEKSCTQDIKKDEPKKEEKKPIIIIQKDSNKKPQEKIKPLEPIEKKDINGITYKYINPTVTIPWQELDKLHPDTLKEIEEENRKVALTYPTMENIVKFKKYQKYLTKKALRFSQVSTVASKQDPILAAWASEIPASRVAITEKRTYREEKVVETFSKLKDNIIILMGDSKTCPFCAKQKVIMKKFESRYNISYKTIDIAENQAFAKQMQIQRTPDLFLLFRENNNEPKIVRIGTGIHTVTELRDIALYGLQTLNKVDKNLAFRWGVKTK